MSSSSSAAAGLRAAAKAARTFSEGIRSTPLPVFLMCDVQERFRPLIHRFPSLVASCGTLAAAAHLLGARIIATEQYPKALLSTVHELQPYLQKKEEYLFEPVVLPKMRFSMMEEKVEEALNKATGDDKARRTP